MLLTRNRAHALIKQDFQNTQIHLLSNREPYEHRYSKDRQQIRAYFMGGGVVRALDPILQALAGTWIAWGSGNADREVVNEHGCVRVPEHKESYKLKRIFLDRKEVEGYYYGFSNQYLWPFCHSLLDKTHFSQSQWNMYKKVNFRYAEETLALLKRKKKNLVWLHDYHLALVAQHIREVFPQIVSMIFWHIPWPKPEIFLQFRKAREFLRGLLCNDVIAFHTPGYAHNFLASVKACLGLKVKGKNIIFGLRKIKVCSHPISIDTESWITQAKSLNAEKLFRRTHLQQLWEAPHLAISVDRLDYTKGLINKVKAYRTFLKQYPRWKGKIVLAQKTMSSRSRIREYQDYRTVFLKELEKLNRELGTSTWKPIVHITKDFDHDMLVAFYKRGDICLVTPKIDGLNLVAKEYVASQSDAAGALLLSTQAGAHEELSGHIPVDPDQPEHIAKSLHRALLMPQREKERRMCRLLSQIQRNNIFTWLLNNLREALPYFDPL